LKITEPSLTALQEVVEPETLPIISREWSNASGSKYSATVNLILPLVLRPAKNLQAPTITWGTAKNLSKIFLALGTQIGIFA